MAEFTGNAEEEFNTDIDIDFSDWSEERKHKLINAIVRGDKFTFEEVPVVFSGEVTIDVEPQDYH